MKIAVPSRQRRLLALCACSAALHFALLELLARHGAGTPAALPSADTLVLRLAPAAAPAAAPARAAPAAPPPAPARRPRTVAAEPAATTPRPAPATGASAAQADAGLAVAEQEAAPPSPPLPGRYRVRLPASVRLDYARTLQRAGAAPVAAGAASIAWETDGQHYSLRVDGVQGRLASDGERGDTGLLPASASDDGDGGGGARTTAFDHVGGSVRFGGGAPDAPAALGIQDRASLLVQLAGMGLAAPDQVAGTIALVVADTQAATVARFQVLGEEDVEAGVGTVRAWHLAEIAAPGQPRLELWLAPEQDWLPVRLSVTGADGSVATQVLTAATRAPSP